MSEQPTKAQRCSYCGGERHNKRTCAEAFGLFVVRAVEPLWLRALREHRPASLQRRK